MTIAPGVVWRTSGTKSSPIFSQCSCERAIPASSPGFMEASIHSVQEFSSDTLNFLHGRGGEYEDCDFSLDLEAHKDGALIVGTPKWNWQWPWRSSPDHANSGGKSVANVTDLKRVEPSP